MKYLPVEYLEALNSTLACIDTGKHRIFGRLECYTCKSTHEEKKLLHKFKNGTNGLVKQSPGSLNQFSEIAGNSVSLPIACPPSSSTANGQQVPSLSSFSPNIFHLQNSGSSSVLSSYPGISRKTLFFLISTLNASFTDYDFSDVKPEAFSKILSLSQIKKNVDKYLHNEVNNDLSALWSAIDQVIGLDDCEFYAFHPPQDAEPEAEEGGNLWSFYYFFFSKPEKKIVFFSCRCVSFLVPLQTEERALVDLMPDTDDLEDGIGNLDDASTAPLTGTGRKRKNSLSVEQYTLETRTGSPSFSPAILL